MDWQGKQRRVDNNHQVLQHVTDYNTGDKVDLDMKTNEVLRNYSQEERIKNQLEEERWKEEGIRNKEKSLREGHYTYYVKEKKIDMAVLESLPPWINDVEREKRTVSWKYVDRRVSDDLLVETIYLDRLGHELYGKETSRGRAVCVDAKYKFRLYEFRNSAKTNSDFIAQNDKYNRRRCKYLVETNKVDISEDELLELAKKIGAIFITEE